MTSDEKMDQLIDSLKEQTSKLRVMLIQKNLSENIKERLNPALKRPHKESPDSELSASKQRIESLICDNKSLHEDLEDCKTVLALMTNKFKDLQRDLELEKLKSGRVPKLQKDITLEHSKQQKLLDTQIRLKNRCVLLLSKLREEAYEASAEENTENANFSQLETENSVLREMLEESTLSDPQLPEAQEPAPHADHRGILQAYKAQRLEQKRSKSFAVNSRKNYLLLSPSESHSSSTVWDSFFSKHAKKGK